MIKEIYNNTCGIFILLVLFVLVQVLANGENVTLCQCAPPPRVIRGFVTLSQGMKCGSKATYTCNNNNNKWLPTPVSSLTCSQRRKWGAGGIKKIICKLFKVEPGPKDGDLRSIGRSLGRSKPVTNGRTLPCEKDEGCLIASPINGCDCDQVGCEGVVCNEMIGQPVDHPFYCRYHVKFGCNKGYEVYPSGQQDTTMTCLNANWQQPQILCVPSSSVEDACGRRQCRHNAQCITDGETSQPVCLCHIGTYGAFCEEGKPERPCDGIICQHRGICVVRKGQAKCRCKKRFTGPKCGQVIDLPD